MVTMVIIILHFSNIILNFTAIKEQLMHIFMKLDCKIV